MQETTIKKGLRAGEKCMVVRDSKNSIYSSYKKDWEVMRLESKDLYGKKKPGSKRTL